MKEEFIVIRPQKKFQLFDIMEIVKYRELLYIFAWRDIKVRYKQTILGVLWVIFQPIVTMIIFTIFFGKLAKIPSYDMPYSLFVLIGLVFWNFFSNSLTHASTSMVANENIIKKVYFPKIILPLSSVITGFVDFSINLTILLVFAFILGYIPSLWAFAVFPLAVVITALTSSGLGLFFSSVNVKYRDVNYILPFFIQTLLFLCPVIYPLAIVGETNRVIMAINPLTTVVESVRMVFLNKGFISSNLIIISMVSSVVIFLFGLWYFKRTEKFFADLV